MRSTGVSGCRRTKMMGNHDFLKRITKSLYYGKLPSIPCLSLPVMELSADVFSEAHKGKSLKRLYLDDAAELTRNACVSPCSLVLALLYLERLKTFNPDYVANIAPAELFLVSLMVSNKFLQDDGEEDEVFADEWATSAGISSVALNQLERKFLHAIDWRVFVNESQFETTLEWLEHQISLRQAKLRGWFTYTDLANINNTVESVGLMKCLVTVYIALSVSYLASVYTLVASSFIVSHSLLTLTSTNHIMNAFGCINPADRLTNMTNTSYSYNTVVDDVPEIYSTNLIQEPSNLRFLEDNRNFIRNNHDQRALRHLSGIQNNKPLYVSFLRNFIQSSVLNECANGSKNVNSYEETNLNGINESAFPSTCKSRYGCIASDTKWINFWTKPVLC